MSTIKAVVFDFGQVICLPPDPAVWEKIASLAGVSWREFEPFWHKYRPDLDGGRCGTAGYYRKITDALGFNASEETVYQMAELDMGAWKNINACTVEFMEDIKKSGYLLGILSNMPFDFLRYARKNITAFGLADVCVFSCEAGVNKPEKGIYEKLLFELKCRPEETVFFDDIQVNVDAGLELGIKALLWDCGRGAHGSCEKARDDLAGFGVKLNRG